MAYIGNNLDSDIQVNKYEYTATAGQTTFACTYDRAVDVYLNGVKLDSSDFTATNGTAVVLASGANVGDIVDINAYFDVTYAGADAILPDQAGNSGKFLTTDGTNSSWGTVDLSVKEDKIPRQATAPTSPGIGDLWYDTDDYVLRVYDGTEWQIVKASFSATGGTISESGGFRYHTFTSSGTFQVTKGSTDIQYLVVAGGGAGGGRFMSGGGGAGGYIAGAATVGVGSHTITVGAGGVGYDDYLRGGTGGNSYFSAPSVTALGGGGGGSWDSSQSSGSSGGSGGGMSGYNNSGYVSGTSGQGNSGAPGAIYGGGGGGGAGANGNVGTGADGGTGGAGRAWENGTYYAGGGGGGDYSGTGTNPGGIGGGGFGANGPNNTSGGIPGPGTANTGGGGGGCNGYLGTTAARTGANGGSGIVIIRYPI